MYELEKIAFEFATHNNLLQCQWRENGAAERYNEATTRVEATTRTTGGIKVDYETSFWRHDDKGVHG